MDFFKQILILWDDIKKIEAAQKIDESFRDIDIFEQNYFGNNKLHYQGMLKSIFQGQSRNSQIFLKVREISFLPKIGRKNRFFG